MEQNKDNEIEESPYLAMREMVQFIARTLATKPDEVSIEEEISDRQVIFHLSLADEDKGRVIGRDGRVAEALRSILKAASVKSHTRAILEIE